MTDNPLTENKTLTVQIRVSAEELTIITALAAKSFMKPGPFMRHLALVTASQNDTVVKKADTGEVIDAAKVIS